MAALTSMLLALAGEPKRKRGRPRKRAKAGAVRTLLHIEYDRHGNPIFDSDRKRKRGERRNIPRKYNPKDLERICRQVEKRQAEGRISFRAALLEEMIDVWLADCAPKLDPLREAYRAAKADKAKRKGEPTPPDPRRAAAKKEALKEIDRVRMFLKAYRETHPRPRLI